MCIPTLIAQKNARKEVAYCIVVCLKHLSFRQVVDSCG